MKGVILAGGLGSRLFPLTKVTNKHLLPVYDRPMIYYPMEKLIEAGIRDILVVTGGNSAGDFLKLLGNGRAFGLKDVHYTYQEGEGGIAAALSLAENFADGERIVVILGDNILEEAITPYVEKFKKQVCGARVLLKKAEHPERFGVAEVRGKKITRVVEKPARPRSPYAVTGIYMYDHQVFDMIKHLQPSRRGELEITDVNNAYIRRGEMEFDILRGFWTDAGTFESLLKANELVAAVRGKEPRGRPARQHRLGQSGARAKLGSTESARRQPSSAVPIQSNRSSRRDKSGPLAGRKIGAARSRWGRKRR